MKNKNAPAPMLDAPIPGQGMTAPLGDRPWQRPAQFSTPEQALSFYISKITQDRQASQMMDILEMGVPVDTLVDTVQLGGVMEGLHSVDVGMIIAPALIEAISGMADKAGVKYTRESTDIDEEAPMGSEIALTLTKMREGKDMPKEAPVEKVVEEVTEEEPTGLMARRR
jgi:hypothetical protein